MVKIKLICLHMKCQPNMVLSKQKYNPTASLLFTFSFCCLIRTEFNSLLLKLSFVWLYLYIDKLWYNQKTSIVFATLVLDLINSSSLAKSCKKSLSFTFSNQTSKTQNQSQKRAQNQGFSQAVLVGKYEMCQRWNMHTHDWKLHTSSS